MTPSNQDNYNYAQIEAIRQLKEFQQTPRHKRLVLTQVQDKIMQAFALLKSEGEVLADEAEDLIKLIEKRKGEL